MVDVSAKDVSLRAAVAAGEVRTTGHVLDLLRRDGLPKGDALAVARLAGIMAAKRTPDLVPLCHPIAIHGVTVELTPRDTTIEITATVKTADRTGVEMEALTCVSVAGLALIDMIKAVDPAATINDVRVLRKEGGKTGLWTRDTATTATAAATERETATAAATERETATAAATEREPATAAATEREPAVIFGTGRVIVASTRAGSAATSPIRSWCPTVPPSGMHSPPPSPRVWTSSSPPVARESPPQTTRLR
jgi:cyclic pyranopterin phosphate synthase